jgi:hypothetical protein
LVNHTFKNLGRKGKGRKGIKHRNALLIDSC